MRCWIGMGQYVVVLATTVCFVLVFGLVLSEYFEVRPLLAICLGLGAISADRGAPAVGKGGRGVVMCRAPVVFTGPRTGASSHSFTDGSNVLVYGFRANASAGKFAEIARCGGFQTSFKSLTFLICSKYKTCQFGRNPALR